MSVLDSRSAAIYKAVGKLVAAARNEKRLTQEGLSKRTSNRLSRSAIANIERGRQRVAVHHLFDLAQALSIPPEALLPGEETVPPIPDQALQQFRDRVAGRSDARFLHPKHGEDGG